MAVAALCLGAVAGGGGVPLAGLSQGVDLLLGRVVGPEGLDKVDRLVGHGADRLGAAVQEHLGHGRLVRALDAAVQTVVGGLEGHLNEGVRGEAHRGDEVLAVGAKVEALKLVLLDQIGEPRLGEAHRDAQLGDHVPLQLVGGGVDVPEALWVSLGRVGAGGSPQRRRFAVDGPREAQDGVGVEVAGEAQHRVAVDARVLKVDTGTAVLTHDNLQLVVPPIRAGADLDALLNLARAAEHVLAECRGGGWLSVV